MKGLSLVIAVFLLVSLGFLFGNNSVCKVGPVPLDAPTAEGKMSVQCPPPIDSICLVFAGVDYGGDFNSPQAYPNAKPITNVIVGTYYFPVVTSQTGASMGEQTVFTYWDDQFKFWSYPDSFTSSGGIYTGRQHIVSDSKGNLHFTWYQRGNPDDYEIYYTRAFLDTTTGIVSYTVERPGVMISSTNGEVERFASMTIYEDTLVMVVWTVGDPPNSIGYNYSRDSGNTWLGPFVAYSHGGPMPGSWQLCSVASDPNTGDMWAAVPFDYTGNVNMDIVALHWNFAAGDTWEHELVIEGQPEPHNFPQCGPIIVVDYNSNPHIIFQENFAPGGGMSGGLYGFNECGPCGTIFYTYRINAGNWKAPDKIKFPGIEVCNYESGLPSVGIATDNTIYFSVTQPESASADTGAYLPFNVHYAEVAPYTGDVSYGGLVSDISSGSSMNAIYGQITCDVPLGGEVPVVCTPGPGITWAQMEAATPPTDIYYVHKDTLATGIEEEPVSHFSPIKLYQNYPNPANNKTMIRFTVSDNTRISLNIYDISGRLIKTLAKGIPGAGSYFVIWNGKDIRGKKVPSGVYLYTLRAGSYTETRKILLVH